MSSEDLRALTLMYIFPSSLFLQREAGVAHGREASGDLSSHTSGEHPMENCEWLSNLFQYQDKEW